jgi:hydroxymethylpyrimidine/phosphomethylpyrimidine kinase
MIAAALTIAGSDPSGGAGIQADLKTFHQFGVYGEAAIALLTVQNTLGVSAIELIPGRIIRQQVEAVLADIRPAAIKTGALGGEEAIQTVAELVPSFECPLVVDPVMVSTSGHRLLAADGERALRDLLLPRCTLVTPNVAEAQILSGVGIANLQNADKAALRIGTFAKVAVLVKGGHLADDATDVLYLDGTLHHFPGKRIQTKHTHGSGCTYSAAITALLAKGYDLIPAIRIAKAFVQRAIETAPALGRGTGPLNHFAGTTGDSTGASS